MVEHMLEALHPIPSTTELGLVMHICKPNAQELEKEKSEVQYHPHPLLPFQFTESLS